MTGQDAVYRRVLRRETHSPRTQAAVTVATVLIVLLVAAVAAGGWWLADPGARGDLAERAGTLSSFARRPTALTVGGTVAVLAAVTLLALAILPGRRARRGRVAGRVALVVDDGVLADAVADAVALRCGVARTQVSATVGRRVATVRVTPTSGLPVDRGAAVDAAAATLDAVGFPVTPKVLVAQRGVVA
ncbi:hypothetical protein [Myceligenerans xiligouense]|uniref:Uncharacterized protein n=1 Tax=Myceligenerans xiligouense TaxID=253184 RepID=A0A3N4YLB0_9MICO|nr:hypothetical protein [Myceligenerans xiligouense]RPF20887.1 hypothetical protein EDD34_1494 [Myceligenerans xiligouense]